MQAWRGFTSSTNSWTGMTATADHQEAITYDANGNILTYLRNGNTSASKPLGMDNLSYFYNDSAGIRRNNRLRHVTDAVAAANYTEDIDGQAVDNYGYDEIGNLTRDNAEKISAITWNVYGKISQITKTASTVVGDLQLIRYGYDASGNRIRKTVYYNQDATNYRAAHTWYVRDASGNVMATYTSAGVMPKTSTRDTTSKVPLYLSELHMYGSSRLGIWSRNVNMDVLPTGGGTVALLGSAGIDTFNRGNKFFELSNHLGNVLVTVSDRKLGQSPVNNLYTSFTADVVSATDYAPGGMLLPGRTYQNGSGSYRYGFQKQELSNEINSNTYTAEHWQYDARLVRRWNVDPVIKHYESSYAALGNNPINLIDPNGTDTLRVLGGKNNSQIDIIYGKGTATHTYNLKDISYLPNMDIGKHTVDLTGVEDPDVIGLDLGASINLSWLGGQVGINLLWKTRGEEGNWKPEVFFYKAAGSFIDKDGRKSVGAGGAASVIFGYASIYDPVTGKEEKYNGANGEGNRWVANGMNWTGNFWTVTGSVNVSPVISLVGTKFWGYDPSKPKPQNQPYWHGFEVGLGRTFTGKSTAGSIAANLQIQYFYLLYGNGGDYLKNGTDVSGTHFLNPKDPEDDK